MSSIKKTAEEKILDAAVENFKARFEFVKSCEGFVRIPVKKTGSDKIYEEYLQALQSA